MNIALIQPIIALGEKQVNFKKIRLLVEQAVSRHPKPDLILLPELWSTGYALAELDNLASREGEEEAAFLATLANRYNVWFAGGSVAAATDNGITNRAQIINRSGDLETFYDKVHLVPMLNEDRYLIAGNTPLVLTIEGITFGFAICYDIRFCEFIRTLALLGAQAVLVSAQWPLVRLSHWQTLLRARAIENQCFIFAANNTATGDLPFAGHSIAIGPDGTTRCAFEFEEGAKQAVLDIEELHTVRRAVPVFKDRRPELYTLG